MIAKRGVTIDATYFHAPPYTSERAKQKVVDLAKIISKYTGPINLHVVNFTDIQLYIYDQCPHEELTIIMRRYMMKLAEHFAKENKCLGLITGRVSDRWRARPCSHSRQPMRSAPCLYSVQSSDSTSRRSWRSRRRSTLMRLHPSLRGLLHDFRGKAPGDKAELKRDSQ